MWTDYCAKCYYAVVSEATSFDFLRKNPVTAAALLLMGLVYLGQLAMAGSAATGAAFTVIPGLSKEVFVMLSPWLHSSHPHLLNNAIMFALLGGWAERRVGSDQFIQGVVLAGYLTNLVPYIVDFGGLGVGASGITNALWTLFALTQIHVYNQIVQMESVNYGKAIYRLGLFMLGVLFILKSVGEFFGYLAPPSGTATGAHLLGVAMGLVWFLYRRAGTPYRIGSSDIGRERG